MSSGETFVWLDFFAAAGIPPAHAASYAEVFHDNRMRRDRLADLNKDLLQEMGVSVLGDVLAILKQARAELARPAMRAPAAPAAPQPAVTPAAPTLTVRKRKDATPSEGRWLKSWGKK